MRRYFFPEGGRREPAHLLFRLPPTNPTTMPFYSTDNMTTYAFTLFEEHYENLEDDQSEEKRELREMIHDIPIGPLKEWVANYLIDAGQINQDSSLLWALLNSIDWDDLRLKLKKWEYDLEDDE